MYKIRKIISKEVIIGKLDHNKDLLEEITKICLNEGIKLGRVEALGAVKRARIAFYNQKRKIYEFIEINKPMEITKLSGNISIKDQVPMVHAHLTLADSKGNVFGGHLAPGTIIFACEIIIEKYEGPLLERGFDETTGLPLWSF